MDSRTPQVIDDTATDSPDDDLDHLDVPGLSLFHRETDAEKVARFAAVGFTGPEFTMWFKELLSDTARILNAWILSEVVFAELRRIGINLYASTEQRLALRQQDADRADLVAYAVSEAGRTFVDALRAGKWKPDGGASVLTYFIRRALYRFPTGFRAWRRQRFREVKSVEKLVERHENQDPLDGTEFVEQVEHDDHFERMLRNAKSDTDRSIMILVKERRSERAIAELLGLRSPKRVRTVKKHMEQAVKEFEGGHDA